jgi:hypothetical protein
MPRCSVPKHTFTCDHCDWVKCGDKRTLKHAVTLHARLVHKVVISLETDLIQSVTVSNSEYKHQSAIATSQRATATILDTV